MNVNKTEKLETLHCMMAGMIQQAEQLTTQWSALISMLDAPWTL